MERAAAAVGAGVARLNRLAAAELERELLACCGSTAWAMVEGTVHWDDAASADGAW